MVLFAGEIRNVNRRIVGKLEDKQLVRTPSRGTKPKREVRPRRVTTCSNRRIGSIERERFLEGINGSKRFGFPVTAQARHRKRAPERLQFETASRSIADAL